MSESMEREVAISQSALAELVKQTLARGGNLTVMAQAMVGVGAHTLGRVFGGERAGELVRNVADSQSLRAAEGLKGINHDDPSEEDHRRYVAGVLDGAPPRFDRDMLHAQAVLHGAMSIAGRLGAAQARETLNGLVGLIDQLVSDRTLRTGDASRDYN